MEAANGDGLHKRSTAPPTSEEAPIASTNVPMTSSKDAASSHEHPGGSAHHPLLQAARIVALMTYFWGACACMNSTQFIAAPVYFYNKEWYYAWMALTKQHFTLLLVTMQQWWTPTTVRVSWHKSVRGEMHYAKDGSRRLEVEFPERMVLIANHQLYTDWLYLWWLSYTARMHGHIYIILKESLKYVPILGWGMQFFSFIFLSRNWTKDKERFAHRLEKLNRKQEDGKYMPMWMLIFPEGTNLSPNSRNRSQAWAEKQGIKDCEHVLLPRSTGLKFCLDELDGTVEWVYDCTLAYEGIPRGQYGQDIFTLRAIYLQGRAPASVNMYWRRFPVKDIPKDHDGFESWLLQRWREKDDLLEHYMQNGRFPADEDAPEFEHKEIPNGAGVSKPVRNERWIETQVMPRSPVEFLQIFVPFMTLLLVAGLIKRFWGWLLVTLAIRSR